VGDWILEIVTSMGYAGIALLTFLENLFPPIPSEVIMPLAGYESSRGEMSLAGAIIAGAAGSLLGCTCWYMVGRWVGERYLRKLVERYGRWLTVTTEDLDRAHDWFHRHGGAAVFFGRLVPGVRTLISVPAGLSCMPAATFLIFSALGTTMWTAALTGAGYWLGESFGAIEKPLGWISTAVMVLTAAWYIYRVVTYPRQSRYSEH
jgi:membrane protein DedA with SNARE-associated domain